MKERPILMSGAMVRATLREVQPKTQTRRVVKLPHNNPLGQWEPTLIGGPDGGRTAAGETVPLQGGIWHTRTGECFSCPLGEPGDHLWVRETCRACELPDGLDGVRYLADDAFVPIGDTQEAAERWMDLNAYRSQSGAVVPAIHMPRWASRITLEITDVCAERLQDISEMDAIAEGIEPFRTNDPDLQGMWRDYSEDGMASGNPIGSYMTLWDSLNAARGYGWDANPWVWVIEFKRVAELNA